MLKLTIAAVDKYDDEAEEFITTEEQTLRLEHSLVSLSRWEATWETPYLSEKSKTNEQTIDYIHCMCLDDDVDPEIFKNLSADNVRDIEQYITAKKTATWFSDQPGKRRSARKEIVTSELIYYWMVTLQIPWECQYWHLNRLITLIEVCNRKNEKPKNMSKSDLAARNRNLNAQRRAQMASSG